MKRKEDYRINQINVTKGFEMNERLNKMYTTFKFELFACYVNPCLEIHF